MLIPHKYINFRHLEIQKQKSSNVDIKLSLKLNKLTKLISLIELELLSNSQLIKSPQPRHVKLTQSLFKEVSSIKIYNIWEYRGHLALLHLVLQ